MAMRSNLRERMADALKYTPAPFADLRVERRQVTRIV